MLIIDKLTKIIQNTLEAIEKSQNQIYEIAEESRNQYKMIEDELNQVKMKTEEIILQVDKLTKLEKDIRYRLMIVNKNFKDFNEEDIKEVYEKAKDLQLQLMVKKNDEQILVNRRTELELRLRSARETLKKAEKLISQIGVVLGYLSGDLKNIHVQLEDFKEKQYLGIKVIQAQEEERYRLSREIHDGPAQILANLVLKSELCEKLIDIDRNKAKEELRGLRTVMRSSLKDVRKIIYDLRPMSLDDLGLIPTVERLVTQHNEESEIFVEFKFFGDRVKLLPVIELAAFRIVQESLNNIKKHSKATRASVKIELTKKNINIVISDNGVGFSRDSIKRADENSGYGLMSMEERVLLLNGKFELNASPGNGTKILITIPIDVYGEVQYEKD
ncbi:sensor histidine kinase [Lutispora saccharofermentans]|uniref:Oxygen sensor histidine kinase NreB n=1 Tax=Lutispora saccharofermentans TaxID=3024236 RepID=A0ABT1NFI0_9FIRM|nr:sensor histidine kinase [Lutispora saccharofermentans]MCQ1530000.1 sensor histidine kinase [Lutispora saccharofermentans]